MIVLTPSSERHPEQARSYRIDVVFGSELPGLNESSQLQCLGREEANIDFQLCGG